jgi:hypothetical protein
MNGLWRNEGEDCDLFVSGCLLGLQFDPEDGSSTSLRNVGKYLPDDTVSYLST